MLPTHHLPSLIPNRVQAIVKRLGDSIWTDVRPLRVEATEATPRPLPLSQAQKLKRFSVGTGSGWGKLFDQRWCRVEFPKSTSAQPLYFNWRDQAEATLYLNGVPYFGFDVAHRHCVLPTGVREGWIESNCVQSAIWHPEATGLSPYGSLFHGAYVCHRDEDAWRAYHDLKCLHDVMIDERTRENPMLSPNLNGFGLQAPVEKASPFYRRLLRLLDEAIDAFDVDGPRALSAKLKAAYAELHQDKTFQRCVLTGHAHIDLVWLWPEYIGELKAVHVFATMNYLMAQYPEFKFAYSQPASYEAVERRSPKLYRTIRDRIRRKQWQATGAMYVESDTLIACGEALARSFTLGQDGFKAITGKASKLTWLPDVFGYSACLPQLMKLTGVEYFFTTKMTWNAINRFPHSSFVWRGSDGSEVVSHVSQDVGYVTQMQLVDIKGGLYGHQQADVHPEYLLPTGYGDGGGGTTDEMIERAKRLGSLPGMPSMAWDHPEAFFDRLGKIKDRLPVHQGECYLEYHRGTFTSHGNLKARFRALERALQVREAVASATGVGSSPTEAWKRMVFAQFHDYIPGSSIPEVYAEALPELERLEKEQFAAAQTALEKGKGKGTLHLFNPLPQPVRRWMKLPGQRKASFVQLPPLAGIAAEEAVIKEPLLPVSVTGQSLSNGLVDLTVDKTGAISKLRVGGHDLAIEESLGLLVTYPEHPANFDAWDIDRQSLSLGELCATPAQIEVRQEGAHRASVIVSRAIGKQSHATVSFSLESGISLVKIEVKLDWNEPETLLKMHFPTRYAATNARFGGPFGSLLRPQLPSGRQAEAMWEVPFSRYLAVFDEGERDGLFLVTQSKYGATVRSGNVGLSLVRSPRITGFDAHHFVRPEVLTRLKPASRYADIGQHVISLAIGRYDTTAPREAQPAALADALFTEPVVYHGKDLQTAYEGLEGGDSLLPSWAQPTGRNGAWILRLHEIGGRRGEAKVKLTTGWTATAVDLLGEPLDKKVSRGRFEYRPHEIISLKIAKS
ncbi:MAG: hypothetical protein B9S32_01785 [Verrucomicrobia bacterium Tous-C9LFEB]|nr:MAG: hypothetical protein B9S32_01785 [Verrucomicrobia bacterium Tous-C9LFEB]